MILMNDWNDWNDVHVNGQVLSSPFLLMNGMIGYQVTVDGSEILKKPRGM